MTVPCTRVSGELTMTGKPEPGGAGYYVLTLHFLNEESRDLAVVTSDDLTQLLELGAQQILEKFDGYVLADYLYEKGKKSNDPTVQYRLERLIDQLLAAGDPKVLPWVLNLLGLRWSDEREWDKAIEELRRPFRIRRTVDGPSIRGKQS